MAVLTEANTAFSSNGSVEPEDMRLLSASTSSLWWASGLALLTFAVDLLTPMGMATGMVYAAVVVLALCTGRRRPVVSLAVVCTGLIVFVPVVKHANLDDGVMLANRVLSTIAIWAFALLGFRYQALIVSLAAREQLQRANQKLRRQISVHKDVEDTLRRNQQRLSAAQEIAVVGSWEWDVGTNTLSWSDELFRICGLSPQDGMTYARFLQTIHPSDRNDVVSALQLSRNTGHPFRIQYRVLRADGTVRILEARGQVEFDGDGGFIRVQGTGQDITELREAQEGLERSRQQLRALSAHLQSVREEERTRIAREIHDELGQALTALKLDLATLARKAGGDAVVQDKVQSMVGLVNETIQTVRRIATELRPAILDDLGLLAALEWQTHEFQKRTGISCELKIGADIDVKPRASTELFRVFQETLTNIARHAGASTVTIFFSRQERHLVLEVHDNGVGIQENQISDIRSLGITGMRERVRLLGGTLQLTGIPGQGTTVLIQIPAEQAEAAP
jgi:PAS domain S-box-containing protein